MKIARQIKIQRLQSKNRMVGKTFNPGGHTSESLDARELEEVNRIKNLTDDEFLKLGSSYEEIDNYKNENNIFCSNSFEQNVFIRNFQYKYDELKKSTNAERRN